MKTFLVYKLLLGITVMLPTEKVYTFHKSHVQLLFLSVTRNDLQVRFIFGSNTVSIQPETPCVRVLLSY